LTQKGQGFVWDAKCEESFQEFKRGLTSAPILILPNAHESFVVYCNAYKMGLGGVLMQSSGCGLCLEAVESSWEELFDSYFGIVGSCVCVEDLEALLVWI